MKYTIFIPEYPGAEFPDVIEAWAEDLGELSEMAGEISRAHPPGEYGVSEDGRPLGILTVYGPGRWLFRGEKVHMGPGFMIL